jgi:ribonuclease P protein component
VQSFAHVVPRDVIVSLSEQRIEPAAEVVQAATFGRERRLREAGEFGEVFAHRRVLRGERFDLHYRPNGGSTARLGLVIAKKLARHSVWRNAIKRTGREAFRLSRQNLPSMDLILRLSKPVASSDAVARSTWRADIEALMARLPR